MTAPQDSDIQETQEWLDSLSSVIDTGGTERAHFLIESMIDQARRSGINLPYSATTAYVNTIPSHLQIKRPGEWAIERRIRALIRWNALMTVLRANKKSPGIGGHIASFQSAATLYDVGFNHFFRAANKNFDGDLIYFQGHSSPGIYARAFLEGRINENQLNNFRMEAGGQGLSSYPHPL
jgi:pyruvate dehydrogenase E1 component